MEVPAVRFCRDCVSYAHGMCGGAHLPRSFVTGERYIVSAETERTKGSCGREGKFWEERKHPAPLFLIGYLVIVLSLTLYVLMYVFN